MVILVIAALVAFALLVRNIQTVWACPAMAVPKGDTVRLISDYQMVNSQVEQSPSGMPNQENRRNLLGAKFFGKLYLLQGYWQMPLASEAQEVFIIVTANDISRIGDLERQKPVDDRSESEK